ncbi:lysine 5,6-aminomutase reactivase subunit KamB [Paramaledivibacter caminithermalis]|jgi:hypothetical protein|uniref:Uncharacterized protein n=1 Tax=Paramaledivibacter caminithermalis (strain DSM 15212 / CIP 107654 / DViRD3) TaxID=1121301 RepID=A0A1M6KGA3_PARC5|nr:hypothetical protein [Paramaledivibacter caminithermalis]SHJ57920.1 hypothetical protein SAMN02745912_00382 [Paramaledivibacter caminithermalis DSM 15212]
MQLLDLIKNKHRTISVVGMAKNSGKTVTLNELIDEAMDNNLRLGITSIGRDGEKQDIVTFTEKPLIYINQGTIIATAEELFKACEANLEILEITDYNTSLGRVVIARGVSPGYVQIAGPCTNKDIKTVTDKMLSHGADIAIVDGALDRLSSASPSITEATILATGAVISRDMNKVIEKTAHQVNLFNIDEVHDEELKTIAREALKDKKIAIIDDEYGVKVINIKTALGCGKEIARELRKNSRYVIISGSLVTKTLKDIVTSNKLFRNVTFIIKDATKIFVDYRDWMYFERIGVKLKVMEKINILAVTINPYSPLGYYFSPQEFLDKMKKILNPLPVLDIMMNEVY